MSPAASSFSNELRRAQRDAQAGPDEQHVADQHRGGAEQAELLTDGGEDEVGGGRGDLLRRAQRDAGAGDAAAAEREQPLHELEALVGGVRPRVDPDAHALLHVGERRPGEQRAGGEQAGADDEVGAAAGGDPEHRDEQCEEQQRRAEVLLRHDDHERDAPGRKDRGHDAQRQLGDGERPDPAYDREQGAVLDEVGGEEQRQRDLGELARLEVDGTEAHPQASAVDRASQRPAPAGGAAG